MARPKPTVSIPDGEPPTALEIEDLEVGSGEAATPGSEVAVHYVGVTWSTHAEFDSSFERGEPFRFVIGKSQVIQGWDQGIVGMRSGGRRRLIIPAQLAYGLEGAGLFIRPNETLVFVVDLEQVGSSSRRFGFGRQGRLRWG